MKTGFRNVVNKGLLYFSFFLLVVSFIPALWVFGHQLWVAFYYPYSINHVEGDIWASVFAAKQYGLYPDITKWPYLPTSYPFLFYLLLEGLQSLFGIGIVAGRIISLSAAVVTAVLVCWWIYKESNRLWYSLLFFLLFFSNPQINFWFLLCRVDSLVLMFMCFSLYCSLKKEFCNRDMFISSVFISLAFFTKVNSLYAGFFCFVIWMVREYRLKMKQRYFWGRMPIKTIFFGVIFFIVHALFLLAIDFYTKGQYYYQVFQLMTQMTDFHFAKIYLLQFFLKQYWLLLIPVCGYASFSSLKWRTRMLFFYLLISLAIMGGTLLREGSDTNYYLEPYVLLLLLWAILFYRYYKTVFGKVVFNFVISFFLLFSGVFYPQLLQGKMRTHFCCDLRDIESEKFAKDEVLALISQTNKDVLVEDVAITLQAGKMPVLAPYVIGYLWDKNLWNADSFLRDSYAGKFEYIVIGTRYRNIFWVDFKNIVPEKYFMLCDWKSEQLKERTPGFDWEIYKYKA